MNRARLGAQYELSYKRFLEGIGYRCSARQAGSKGAFDLVTWTDDESVSWSKGGGCWHVQLSSKRMSCAKAKALSSSLSALSHLPRTCGVVYVHRTTKKEFCEH